MDQDAIIRVEGLGKRYVLGTQATERYTALRDVVANSARNLFRRRSAANAGEFWALRDVSFDVRRGEVLGIIGRNGAGKSTLLKVLSRITEPTTGRISLHGRVASLLEVGTGFHPELTGRENIFLNGAILGMPRADIKAKFDEIVDFAEVAKFLDTPVKRYSSGMYVRLAFAVAAHLEPEILIVDEVLAVGDSEFQKKCLGKMQQVATGSGRTVLFVSHNMTAVSALCSQVMWLKNGSCQGIGATAGMIESYLTDGANGQESERTWEPDGSERPRKLHLRKVRILDDDGQGCTEFDHDEAVTIEISYELRVPVPGMRICLRLITSDGIVAFQSNDDSTERIRTSREETGRFSIRCTIPAKLLNHVTYFLGLSADVPFVEILFQEDGFLRFHVHQVEAAGGRLGETFPGAVHPDLDWHVCDPQDAAQRRVEQLA